MKFKFFLIILLMVAAAGGGCKKQQAPIAATVPETTTAPTEETVVTEPPAPKAGLLLRQAAGDEQDAIELQAVLEHLGYEVLVKDSENDQSKQNTQAVELLDAGCELLVIQPVMTTGLDVLVEQLKPSGVPVVLLDYQPEQTVLELYDRLTYLGADHTQAGAVQAQLLQTLPGGGDLNGDGTVSVLMLRGPEDHMDANSRAADFTAGLDAEKHMVLETVVAEWSQEGGRNATAQMLAKYGPDIEVLVTPSADMAHGAIEAIENGGRVPGKSLYLLSIGSSTAIMNEVTLGRVSGLAAPDPEARYNKLSELITALASNQPVEKINLIDYIPIM